MPTVALLLAGVLALPQSSPPLTRDQRASLDAIAPAALRSHVDFLASDLLEGRDSPSRGLDLAAEYIAGHFRRAGLTPGVGDSYFQMATMRRRGTPADSPGLPVKNVVGVIPGVDPVLKDQTILVTAHYDHLGLKPNATENEDAIFNGANDNASSVSGIIELGYALVRTRPRRTVVFILFYGEEKGLVGAFFYGLNPLFPLRNTVANINIEQIGRVDDLEGPRRSELSMTGYDFSDLGDIMNGAARPLGVGVTKHPRFSDEFFARSDNAALASLGIPAHTVCTAFMFPDYHAVGDEAAKIDFENMARVTRAIGAGVLAVANREARPQWNSLNPRTKRYVDAWTRLQGQ